MGVSGVYVDDPDFTLYVGDVRDVLATMPDESVHCVVTSPPYWGLRDYGTGEWDGGDPDCEHRVGGQVPDSKAKGAIVAGVRPGVDASSCLDCGATRVDRQLGLEATPDEYVANMVAVFRKVRRVLRRDGTCWINLGDSYNAYNGNRGLSGSTLEGADRPEARPKFPSGHGLAAGDLKPKDLVGIPWRVAFALQADDWYLRSDIVWAKPNPMPESVTDRPTKSHEYVFLLTRSPRYFFDQDAVREPAAWERWGDQTNSKHEGSGSAASWIGSKPKGDLTQRSTAHYNTAERYGAGNGGNSGFDALAAKMREGEHRGRNVRSVWEIATQPYAEAHFATFPEELARRCIAAGTSEYGVCPECGAPWEREVERKLEATRGKVGANNGEGPRQDDTGMDAGTAWNHSGGVYGHYNVTTTGWRPSCGHDLEPVPATCLDPFMGSGTVAHVARKLGRRSIGIELNPDYAALCARRLQQLSLLA